MLNRGLVPESSGLEILVELFPYVQSEVVTCGISLIAFFIVIELKKGLMKQTPLSDLANLTGSTSSDGWLR